MCPLREGPEHLLSPKAPYPAISRDDPMAGHPRRERVVPQRVAHRARRRGQVVRQREIGRVGARRHLAEGEQDAFAEGGEGRMRGNFRQHARIDRW